MYGFTIVLRRKNKYQSDLKRAKRNCENGRTRRRIAAPKNRKLPIRFSKLLPMVFLVFAVAVGAVLSKNQPSGAAAEKQKTENSIDIFVLPEDDYSFYYVPLVINGIEEYDEGDGVTDEMIAACCWSLLSDSEAGEKYELFDEKTIIPKEDVQERFEKIFGRKTEIKNRSVNVNGCKFDYSDGKYTIETTGMIPPYLPKLLKRESESGKVTLTVGCLKNDEYAQDKDGNTVEPTPKKRLKFVLEGRENELYVKSVEVTK